MNGDVHHIAHGCTKEWELVSIDLISSHPDRPTRTRGWKAPTNSAQTQRLVTSWSLGDREKGHQAAYQRAYK
jgi:hypothetical protein